MKREARSKRREAGEEGSIRGGAGNKCISGRVGEVDGGVVRKSNRGRKSGGKLEERWEIGRAVRSWRRRTTGDLCHTFDTKQPIYRAVLTQVIQLKQ